MIFIEPWEPNVAVVMRGGAMIGAYQATQIDPTMHMQPQVRPAAKKKAPIDIQEQKHIFMDVCLEFISAEKPSTSSQVKDMPERFQKIFEQRSIDKTADRVSKIKPFLSSCLALIKDKEAIAELQSLIETLPKGNPLPKKVNSIKTKLKTRCELKMTVQIGDYDMDYIILNLGSDVNILTC